MMTAIVMTAGVEMPPKQFDIEPTTPYTIHYTGHEETQKKCAAQLAWAYVNGYKDAVAYGCAVIKAGKTPRIYIDKTLDPAFRAQVLRHEKGHVNGWVH